MELSLIGKIIIGLFVVIILAFIIGNLIAPKIFGIFGYLGDVEFLIPVFFRNIYIGKGQ